jgi:hypothetical protein
MPLIHHALSKLGIELAAAKQEGFSPVRQDRDLGRKNLGITIV